MLHLYDDRIVHSVVPIADGVELGGYSMDLLEELEALDPDERHELISSKSSSLWAEEA